MTGARKFAVVTGASGGIGLELAVQFAQNGFDLLICAEDGDLEGAASRSRAAGAEVLTVQQDLREPTGVEALYAAINEAGRPVDAAAVNAGIGRGGRFVDTPVENLLDVARLNVVSTVHLTRLLLADMVARGEGRLLITSSIASTMPGTFAAVYNASKSFDQSLAEALGEEVKGTGVTVTSLMPGPTDTNFFRRAQMAATRLGRGPKDDPADVARQGFEAMMAGRPRVVAASLGTKALEAAAKVLPDAVKAKLHRVMASPPDR